MKTKWSSLPKDLGCSCCQISVARLCATALLACFWQSLAKHNLVACLLWFCSIQRFGESRLSLSACCAFTNDATKGRMTMMLVWLLLKQIEGFGCCGCVDEKNPFLVGGWSKRWSGMIPKILMMSGLTLTQKCYDLRLLARSI